MEWYSVCVCVCFNSKPIFVVKAVCDFVIFLLLVDINWNHSLFVSKEALG